MKMTLSQKILTGFIVCALILGAVAVFSFRNNERFMDTNKWVVHTHDVLHEFDRVLECSLSAETGSRGYVITGSDMFLEPYNRSRREMHLHLDALKALTTDNPIQQRNIAELQKKIEEREKNLATVVELRKASFEQAQAFIATGVGKQLQEDISQLIYSSKDMEQKLRDERKQAADEDARSFSRIFLMLLIIIAVVLISVFLIITSNLRALKKAEKESANKNWILSGNFQLNEVMRGERTEADLSQSIINLLCAYLEAQIGVIYLFDDTALKLMGSYAYNFRKENKTTVKIGEGLVGQAAAEKKMIVFTDVPDDYIRINSGLGNIMPKNLVILPLLHDGAVKGVIELGFAKPITDLKMEFIDNIGENIAIVVNAAQARTRMRELLEETQRQAEELEAQQEELKQSNEELQEKTVLLEKSESALKTQQEELQQTNEELEEKANLLEEQKEKLENAKMDIETKARELEVTGKYKSEFLANMSHELRTPLNSVLILAQLLSENKNKILGDKEVEFARNIYNSGTDLLNLINEILDLSKVESGKMELDISQVQLSDIKTDVSAMFTEVARNKTINFAFDLAPDVNKNIETDRQRLEQILRNLLSNAFKFTSKGGKVQLSVTKADKNNTAFKNRKLYQAPEIISFAVTDTGIGIPEDKLTIIFEAFQQADGSTKRKYGGTGLGLSISRELANALGGEIHLKSQEGKGSTFTLYLPARYDANIMEAMEREVEVKRKPVEKMPRLKPVAEPEHVVNNTDEPNDDRYNIKENDKVVLIMEDDKEFAHVLLTFARERNYKGIIAYEGNTGLSYARHYKPDAIMLDMKLPIMDGSAVLRQLKNDPELRHIPVQVISGYDRKKEGMDLGAFDFMQKPISKDDLQNAFNKIEDFVNRKLKKLLIVEDNEEQNNAIRELIGNGDVKSYSAYSGKDAYEMMINEGFDCVIVDLGLPDMTGFDLLQRIKDNSELRKTPVIVYTGRDLTKDENSRLGKLANTVVLKTVDSNERLLDETTLFLHRVESRLPKEKQNIIRKLHKTDEVLKHKKVLIVDDDIRNIYSLTNVLEEEGLACITAENGRAAVQALHDDPGIDIVLMDVMMPEMDGYDATREIRKHDKFMKLPIIALTAKAMKGDREKCLSAGMSDYISKPVNIDQLLSLMRVWLYK